MSEPKPVIVIMDERLEMRLPLAQAKDETWIYVYDCDGKRLAPERLTTGDHIDYDALGEVTSGNQPYARLERPSQRRSRFPLQRVGR